MPAGSEQRFDLLLHGGQVFEPATGSFERLDLAIRDGVVAVRAANLDAGEPRSHVDLAGMQVVPGLIDLHVHSYVGGSHWGTDVDEVSLRSGVTTVVDAGSAGAFNFSGLAPMLASSRLSAFAFLNVAGTGLAGPFGELLSRENLDPDATIKVARQHPGLIRGLKLRASPNTVGDNWRTALQVLRECADALGLPVMVHVSDGPPDLPHVLEQLKAGDILTHCFTPYDNGAVRNDGRVREEVLDALERGVLLDVGHGSGSFSFPKAEAYMASGLPLPIISTDLHKRSVLGPAFGMSTVMTKLLASGAAPKEVIRSATIGPARALGLNSSLHVGERADLAVMELDERPVKLWDSRGNTRVGERRFVCRMTVRGGDAAFVDPALRLIVH